MESKRVLRGSSGLPTYFRSQILPGSSVCTEIGGMNRGLWGGGTFRGRGPAHAESHARKEQWSGSRIVLCLWPTSRYTGRGWLLSLFQADRLGICRCRKLIVASRTESVKKMNPRFQNTDLKVNPSYCPAIDLNQVHACGSCWRSQSADHIGCVLVRAFYLDTYSLSGSAIQGVSDYCLTYVSCLISRVVERIPAGQCREAETTLTEN